MPNSTRNSAPGPCGQRARKSSCEENSRLVAPSVVMVGAAVDPGKSRCGAALAMIGVGVRKEMGFACIFGFGISVEIQKRASERLTEQAKRGNCTFLSLPSL